MTTSCLRLLVTWFCTSSDAVGVASSVSMPRRSVMLTHADDVLTVLCRQWVAALLSVVRCLDVIIHNRIA